MAIHQIIIPRDGITTGEQKVRAIYSPQVAEMMALLGESELRRASHVEPGSELKQSALLWLHTNMPGIYTAMCRDRSDLHLQYLAKWWADLLPVGGPVLGPFDTNTEALNAEVAYLKEHNIPICEPCREAAVAEITGASNG